ncbi:FdhC protein [Aliarcobacter trophiarum LMG 25534]|uniref:FdhC protein n=1 Tax=Aliarcobacter trophiarum LMG 25534 TaxID=1032241 RepID=A0AAD0VMK1_9BACT|nr:cytochrome b/b6 domain-containing protein [Aliarcobacter trophiarum]AXK48975.1 formate dehydrogenase N, cytochrome b-556 subunit [Aliarcobacter trophiarum LMG 25534]RXI24845.1 FdhC protein [Aliarcobacter trophiarum]RXJ92706.1 FdhC protein [Aliarcobacter trophiarum LMG 25534]
MENSSFMKRNGAYIYTLLGLGLVGFVFVNFLMIMDWGYLFRYTIHVLTGGNLDGILEPARTGYIEMVNRAFGPEYNAIAPEIIRASNERQLYIWWVFVAEIAIFCVMYAFYGRKEAIITNPNDTVEVFSVLHRAIIWLNVIIILTLIITGFNITWSLRSEGGYIPFILRGTHEVTGLLWFPIWLLMSIIAFKDLKILSKNSLIRKITLFGKHTPMKRVIFIVFVLMGGGLLFSGFLIWFIHPDALTNAQFIQFKRALLYVHFGASVLIMFFLMDFVYSSLVAVKGNLKGLITGKYPREYLEQLAPDILEDIKKREGK